MKRPPYSVGIDLHKTIVQVCVLDSDGEILKERRFRGGTLEQGLEVIEFCRAFEAGRFAVEAVGMNRWFVNGMREAGMEVVVVDPAKLNLRMLGKKTDRRDAYEIARRLLLGDIDRNAKTYYPTEPEYGARKVVRTRHSLVHLRQQIVNQIRGLLNAYRTPAPQGALYRKKALATLKALCLANEDLSLCLGVLTQKLEQMQEGIQAFDAQIKKASEAPEVAALVDCLPDVGAQTATTLLREFGDVTRFRNARAAASYAGLVPRVANSADKSHHGAITKRGNTELRWILCQWAVRLLTRNELARRWAAPKYRRMHKNKIRVALARKLAVGIYVLLARGEVFSLERCLGVA